MKLRFVFSALTSLAVIGLGCADGGPVAVAGVDDPVVHRKAAGRRFDFVAFPNYCTTDAFFTCATIGVRTAPSTVPGRTGVTVAIQNLQGTPIMPDDHPSVIWNVFFVIPGNPGGLEPSLGAIFNEVGTVNAKAATVVDLVGVGQHPESWNSFVDFRANAPGEDGVATVIQTIPISSSEFGPGGAPVIGCSLPLDRLFSTFDRPLVYRTCGHGRVLVHFGTNFRWHASEIVLVGVGVSVEQDGVTEFRSFCLNFIDPDADLPDIVNNFPCRFSPRFSPAGAQAASVGDGVTLSSVVDTEFF